MIDAHAYALALGYAAASVVIGYGAILVMTATVRRTLVPR